MHLLCCNLVHSIYCWLSSFFPSTFPNIINFWRELLLLWGLLVFSLIFTLFLDFHYWNVIICFSSFQSSIVSIMQIDVSSSSFNTMLSFFQSNLLQPVFCTEVKWMNESINNEYNGKRLIQLWPFFVLFYFLDHLVSTHWLWQEFTDWFVTWAWNCLNWLF